MRKKARLTHNDPLTQQTKKLKLTPNKPNHNHSSRAITHHRTSKTTIKPVITTCNQKLGIIIYSFKQDSMHRRINGNSTFQYTVGHNTKEEHQSNMQFKMRLTLRAQLNERNNQLNLMLITTHSREIASARPAASKPKSRHARSWT